MKICREFDFGFNSLILVIKSHLCEHNAHLIQACVCGFILILNVWMHVPEEKLLIIFVCKLKSDTLSCRFSLCSKLIIRSDNTIEDLRIENLDFHFQSLIRVKFYNSNHLRNWKQLYLRSISIHWALHKSTLQM